MTIDASKAFQIAQQYVRDHGPDFWAPPFIIRFDDRVDQWTITTNCDNPDGSADIFVDDESGQVIETVWNPG